MIRPPTHSGNHDNDHDNDDKYDVDNKDGDMEHGTLKKEDTVNHSDLAREEAETIAVQETADHRLKVSKIFKKATIRKS